MSIENKLSLRQLRAFVAIYRLGRLGIAATHLSVTESAVSIMLRQIESTLDMRLFDRTSRGLEPTAAAHEAIVLAERILGDVASLGDNFRELNEKRRGQVHIVITPTVGITLLPSIVRRFREAYPGVRVILDDCAPDQFLSRVLAGPVDFGIGTLENEEPMLESRPLLRDHLCLVCADDHPLAGRRQVRWKDLGGYPLIAVRSGLGYGMRRKLEAAAASVGVQLQVSNEVNFLSSALWMTAGGLGVSVWASALVAQTPFDNLVRCKLIAPRVPSNISVVSKRGSSLSPAANSFLEIVADEMSALDTL